MTLAVVLAAALGTVTWQQLSVTRGTNTESAVFTEHASGWDPLGNRLVVFNRDGRTYQLNAASATWEVINTGDVNPPTRFSTVYGVDNVGLVISLGQQGSTFFNDVWRFNFSSNTWTQLIGADGPNAPEQRYGAAGGVHQNTDGTYSLMLSHGFSSSTRYSNTFSFHLTTMTWTCVDSGENEYSLDTPHARCLVPSAVTQSGELFMFGGCASGGKTGGPCPAWDGWCRTTAGDWHRITDGSPHPRTRGLMVRFPPQPSVSMLITSGTTSTGNQWLEGSAAPGGDVGIVDCNSRKWMFKRPGGPQPPRLFDASVAWNATHIFVTGGNNGDNGNQNEGVNTWVLSWDAQLFENVADAKGAGDYLTLVILHGVFMFLAWGILCPIGAFLARYLKASDPLWFKLHRIIMSVGVLFTLIGFALIVPAINGSGHFAFIHGAIGLDITLVAVYQPINGIFRPAKPEHGEKKSTWRFIWELLHRWSGRIGLLLGLVNIVLGTVIAVAPIAVFALAVAWVGGMVLLWTGAELYFRFKYGFCGDWKQKIADELHNKSGAPDAERDGDEPEQPPTQPDAPPAEEGPEEVEKPQGQ